MLQAAPAPKLRPASRPASANRLLGSRWHPSHLGRVSGAGNEDSVAENFNVFTLICETNAASVRWYGVLEELPFTPVSAAKKGSIFGGT